MKLPTLSRKRWWFFANAWLIFAAGLFGMFLFAARTETATGDDIGFWLLLAAMFLGPPTLIGIVSLALFGATGRIKNTLGVIGCGAGIMVATVMTMAIKPAGMLHGARTIVYGSAAGSPADIAKTDAAWVDVSPAFVDTTRMGAAVSSRTDSKGNRSTRSRAVAPILTALGERDRAASASEQVALFVCLDDVDDVRDAARGNNGTISGRMHRADFLELEAMADARVEKRIETPRCVVPGRGASAFWFVLWILVILAGATGGAALVVSVASKQ